MHRLPYKLKCKVKLSTGQVSSYKSVMNKMGTPNSIRGEGHNMLRIKAGKKRSRGAQQPDVHIVTIAVCPFVARPT